MAAHPDAASPSEQTCRSPEILALEKSCDTLITGIKMDPNSVCIALVSEGLIPATVREYCSSSAKLDSEKGQKLFNTMISQVEIDPAVYHKILAKLEAYDWLKNCLVILRRNYEAEKAKAKTPKEAKKATAQKEEVHGENKKTAFTLRGLDLRVEIEGVWYYLDKVPAVNSKIVMVEREHLFEPTEIKCLVIGVPDMIRMLNNAIVAIGPRFTQEQRDMQRFFYGIFSLYDKSALTAEKINSYFSIFTNTIEIPPSTYNEEKAIKQLQMFSKLASEMQKLALQTVHEFENEKEQCIKKIEEMMILRRNFNSMKGIQSQTYSAVETIHIAIYFLKQLLAVTMQGELFWQKMYHHCKSLEENVVESDLDNLMKYYSEEKRFKVWTCTPFFKTKIITYYASWIALHKIFNDYIDHIEQKRNDLQRSIDENPSTEESRSNLKEIHVAEKLLRDLKRDQH